MGIVSAINNAIMLDVKPTLVERRCKNLVAQGAFQDHVAYGTSIGALVGGSVGGTMGASAGGIGAWPGAGLGSTLGGSAGGLIGALIGAARAAYTNSQIDTACSSADHEYLKRQLIDAFEN